MRGALCDDAVVVPRPVPEVHVRHQARRRGQPAAAHRLPVDVAGKAPPRLDLDLRSAHPAGPLVRRFARSPLPSPRADLDARIQRVVDSHLELELEIAIRLLGHQERVRAALARPPNDRAIRHPIGRPAVPLHPAIQRPAVEQRDPAVCSTGLAADHRRHHQHRVAQNDPAHRSSSSKSAALCSAASGAGGVVPTPRGPRTRSVWQDS
jgi:hypothetical protein